MALRKPLVLVGGRYKELPTGDTLPAGEVTLVQDTAPALPNSMPFWFDPTTLALFFQYDDGDTVQWVEISGGGTLPATST